MDSSCSWSWFQLGTPAPGSHPPKGRDSGAACDLLHASRLPLPGFTSLRPAAHDAPVTRPLQDTWLEAFLPRLRQAGGRLLDAGCGYGADAAMLADSGFQVVACDRLRPAGAPWNPPAAFLLADLQSLPFRPATFGVVIASLSLHYLPWSATLAAFRSIGALVVPGGCFLFRVNASDDIHHGAGQGEQLEPGFFRVPHLLISHSETRRFFTADDVHAVVPPGFSVEHLAHRTIRRYEHPKQVWECLLVRHA